jgi:two-component system OmpR family response regulator
LRSASAQLPIIFLSARDSDFDIVSGLRLGADDYLTKDVSLPHLLARIAALFRRVTRRDPGARRPTRRCAAGRSPSTPKRMAATWNGKPVDLTVTEFWMVRSLARHPGHVKDRDQLMRDAENGRRRRHASPRT